MAVDTHVFRVKFLRKDKLTMPNMAVPVASIYNSMLAKQHVTPEDPWAATWLKSNTAGGGAYKLESWKPGQEIIYVRNDDWKSGPLPRMRRIIQRDVPSAGNRRALLLKGDIDMTYDLPPKDFSELSKDKSIRIASQPIENAMIYLGMNTTRPPFNNPLVRQAVLRRQIAEARRRGYASSDEPAIPGASAVAAPVVDHTGAVLGSIGVYGPSSRFTPDKHESVGRAAIACAKRVSVLIA